MVAATASTCVDQSIGGDTSGLGLIELPTWTPREQMSTSGVNTSRVSPPLGDKYSLLARGVEDLFFCNLHVNRFASLMGVVASFGSGMEDSEEGLPTSPV